MSHHLATAGADLARHGGASRVASPATCLEARLGAAPLRITTLTGISAPSRRDVVGHAGWPCFAPSPSSAWPGGLCLLGSVANPSHGPNPGASRAARSRPRARAHPPGSSCCFGLENRDMSGRGSSSWGSESGLGGPIYPRRATSRTLPGDPAVTWPTTAHAGSCRIRRWAASGAQATSSPPEVCGSSARSTSDGVGVVGDVEHRREAAPVLGRRRPGPARCGCLTVAPGRQRQRVELKLDRQAGGCGHLGGVAGEAEAGDVGDRMGLGGRRSASAASRLRVAIHRTAVGEVARAVDQLCPGSGGDHRRCRAAWSAPARPRHGRRRCARSGPGGPSPVTARP